MSNIISLTTTDNSINITLQALSGAVSVSDEAITEAKLDVLNTPTDGYVLAYDSATGRLEWVANSGGGGGISSLVEDTTPQLGGNLDLNGNNVGDADATDLTKLSELTATSTELNYVDGVTSAIQTQIDGKLSDITGENIEDLSNVSITSIVSGEILKWNGVAWVNNTLAEAGIAGSSHTHSASDINSGTFSDARVAESNVTQHQGALSITESQISDLRNYLLNLVEDTSPQLGGDLDINGNDITGFDDSGFEIIEGTTFSEFASSTDLSLYTACVTGVDLDGVASGIVDISAGTTFNVGATVGGIRTEAGFTRILYAGSTGNSPVASSGSIWVYIDTLGALQQQTTAPTLTENRTKLFLTRLAMSGGSIIAQEPYLNPLSNTLNSFRDYLSYVASPKKGLGLSANGVNLNIDIASGTVFELGTSPSTPNSPNEVVISAKSPATFVRQTQSASLGSTTTINVTEYDVSGTMTTMTNSRFKVITFYQFNSGNVTAQEGQNQYLTLDEAQTALASRTFIVNPSNANGTRIGWLIVQKNATDLSDTSQARFINDEGTFSTSVGTSGALIASNNLSDLTNANTAITNLGITATATELNYSSGVTSAIQTQLNGKASTSHTHSTADVTSGTFADARIAESNVTQHQGALSITESQISDLGAYLENVVEDTSPQLGGNLDVNGQSITSTANGNVNLSPNGTGQVTVGTSISFTSTTNAGVKLNSLTTTERNALTPVAGDLIYNETDGIAQVYDGTQWVNLAYEVPIQATIVDYTTDIATGDGQYYFRVPSRLNGMNLTAVHAEVITAGTTGTTDIQIHNVTDAVDMLSTKLTIDSGETGSDTAVTAAVINTSNDDVATNDLLRVDVDAISTTAPKGLIVTLEFSLP